MGQECGKCGVELVEDDGKPIHLFAGTRDCGGPQRTVTTATVNALRYEIMEFFKEVCPDPETPVGQSQMHHVEYLVDTLYDHTWDLAVKRQGKVIAAALDGSLTWRKGDNEADWVGREAVDAEEDAIDAMEEQLNPKRPALTSEERLRAEERALRLLLRENKRRDEENGWV